MRACCSWLVTTDEQASEGSWALGWAASRLPEGVGAGVLEPAISDILSMEHLGTHTGHPRRRQNIPEQIPIPGFQFLQLKSKAAWPGEVISNTWVNVSLQQIKAESYMSVESDGYVSEAGLGRK